MDLSWRFSCNQESLKKVCDWYAYVKKDKAMVNHRYCSSFNIDNGLEFSVVTVAKSGLPPELRKLRRQFNIKLVSFENAMISLPPFRQFRYFETFSFLMETLSKFYLGKVFSTH